MMSMKALKTTLAKEILSDPDARRALRHYMTAQVQNADAKTGVSIALTCCSGGKQKKLYMPEIVAKAV
jgi:cysteine synthase